MQKELLHQSEERMKKTIETMRREMARVRTGKATPALLESVTVDPVGTRGAHKGLVRTVGGSFADAGTYGFATDKDGGGIFAEERPADGWTLLVHARDVEVI